MVDNPKKRVPPPAPARRALVQSLMAVLCALVLVGCTTGGRENPYFPSQEAPASVLEPAPEVMAVPGAIAPMMGGDIVGEVFDTNPPPVTNIVAHIPPQPVPTRWGTGWVTLERFAAECGAGKPQRTILANTSRYTVVTRNGSFLITMGSKLVRLNGLNLWLGFPAQVMQGQPCIHALDAEKMLQPLFDASVITAPGKTIVIDPGHGGVDAGTRGTRGEREKDFTLDWALRIERMLTNSGWHVVLTRRMDVDVSLPDRVAIAERARADFFISLHFNSAAPHAGPSGIETYCLTPAGMPSTLSRGYVDDPRSVFPNNAFDRANIQLAARLHREIVAETRALDDGIKRARFMGVLRGQNRPAVLIEGGYLSNPAELVQISNPRYRQRLAAAVARALKN